MKLKIGETPSEITELLLYILYIITKPFKAFIKNNFIQQLKLSIVNV